MIELMYLWSSAQPWEPYGIFCGHRRRLDCHSLAGVLRLDQQIAQGTALVAVVPNVMLALWRYHPTQTYWKPGHAVAGFDGVLFRLDRFDLAVGTDAQIMRIGFVAFLVALLVRLYNLLVRMFTVARPRLRRR